MKAAIITGASVGIGCATAERFLREDYRVFNLSRRPCPAEGVENIPVNLADPTSIAAASEQLLRHLTQCTTVSLIHNAAQMRKDSTGDCDSDDLRAVLETNVVAINSLNQAILPALPRSSSLLYVGSTLSEKAVPGSFSYVVSKHAQLGIMRATCQDLMGSGVHTALVCPGFTDTEMLRTHLGNDSGVVQSIGAMNSFGRLIEPDEIAELLFWAHTNPVINGAVLHANLGQKEA
jgi:NAD(P)-dependent dehydrogenase (short-subunit alcohol dehydrogenase family)